MALRLLRAVPLWGWMLLAALGWGGWQWWQADQAAHDLATSRANLDKAKTRADRLDTALAWQRAQAQLLTTVLEAHAQQLADDRRAIDQQRESARQLERDDEATADWADQPVPAAARRWLQQLSEGAAGADADGAELPAQAAAGTGAAGEP